MVDTRKYTVDRIVDGSKIVLLDDENKAVQVVVDQEDFAPVKEGDVVLVTWTGSVGGSSYAIVLDQETEARRTRIQAKLDRLKKKPRNS